ncbi:enoyl-CoA hydratase/isomerase family protein [Caldalkalibacillus uzonensis]|nr:enoyl-CoA hydratase-related protein [Caldalkalibacillus uzonensis]
MTKVRFENENGVVIITIDSPPVNVLDKEVLAELSAVIDQINDETDVVIIQGAGEKAFVAGADIKEFPELNQETGKALCLEGQAIFQKLEDLPQPVIAAIDGYALGGGLELALACDFRIATERSKFGLPEVSLGIIPGYGGTQRLPRLIGEGKAKQMIFSGEIFSAEEAYRIGIIEEITPNSALEGAQRWAEIIRKRGQLAVQKAKQAINEGRELSLNGALALEASLFGQICETKDKNEGVAAFIERREPNFQKK